MMQELIVDYNKHMGYVDKNDQVLASHTCVRKCRKWTTKVAFHFFEEAIHNAFILFRLKNTSTTFKDFKVKLLDLMINNPVADPCRHLPRKIGRHFLEPIPATGKKVGPTKRCIVCTKNKSRRETRYQCQDCPDHPPLCVHPCNQRYHTLDFY